MSVAIVCASHTPLMYRGPASNETEQRVRTAFERLGSFVKEFAPDYVIQFAPDHFNGFFYDLMPSFCVGAGAVSLGDWGGGTGPLDVPEKTALELVDHVRAEDFDVAVSYRMPVDHGFVQMWEAVLGDFKSVPILPIFVNAAAPPFRPTGAPGNSANPSAASRCVQASGYCSPHRAACRTIRRCRRSRTRHRRSASA